MTRKRVAASRRAAAMPAAPAPMMTTSLPALVIGLGGVRGSLLVSFGAAFFLPEGVCDKAGSAAKAAEAVRNDRRLNRFMLLFTVSFYMILEAYIFCHRASVTVPQSGRHRKPIRE